MIEWDNIERWKFIVDSVTTEYNRKFPMVESPDLRQTLYQWFVEHPNKLREWEALGEKHAKNLIYRSLRNQALDYCQKWKAKSGGYDTSDLYYYDVDVVEFLLPYVLRGEVNSAQKIDLGMPSKPSAPAEGGNFLAMMIEIDYAFWKLAKDEQRLLFLKYGESMDYETIGLELKIGSEDATRMKNKRVLKKLIHKIGGFKPYKDYDSEIEVTLHPPVE